MTIVLVRHGETLLNAARTLQPADTPLGPRGLAQAHAVARRLAGLGLAAIVSSDLARARQTAEAIAAACALPILLEPLLQERNFGDLRGQPYDALGFDPLTLLDAPPGGESVATFGARVAEAFARITGLRAELGGPLAVVTHGLVIGAILESHAQLGDGMELPSRLANSSLTILAPQTPHAVELLDCTAHLTASIDDDPLSLSG